MMAQSIREVRLDYWGGTLYYGSDRDDQIAACQLDELQQHPDVWKAETIRVIGTAENAALIVQLHELRKSHKVPGIIYLGSLGPPSRKVAAGGPQACAALFKLMDRLPTCASTNGWHRMTEHDVTIYRMLAARQQHDQSRLQRLAKVHPAWRVFEFLQDGHLSSAIDVLCRIVDPRWFYDSEQGNVHTRLRMHLGFTIGDAEMRMKFILSGCKEAEKIYRRDFAATMAVLQAWAGTADIGGKLLQLQANGELQQPHRFLWRIVDRGAAGNLALATIKASMVFLNLLADVWLDTITPHRELFIPEYYFSTEPETAKAWRAFVNPT